jgi:hypothetical protein
MKLLKRTRFSDTKLSKDYIYIFPDNCDRTVFEGLDISDDTNYSKKYGKTGLKKPIAGPSCIRGDDVAFPITTKKSSKEFWNDEDYKEFKKVINDDIKEIKKACKKLKPKAIYFPPKGILNTVEERISFERTPRLYEYIIKKEIELSDFKV